MASVSNALETTAIELTGLRDRIGEVIGPRDPGYDEARAIWNGAIDRRPGAIVRCSSVAEVVEAVRFARERGLLVSVRGGGHGVGGFAVCDEGLVIDLSPLKRISVDPAARQATAGAGVLWGELDAATQRDGLATVGGIVTHTGIGGLTLGGGIGWLMRKHGATVDNLLAVELVTADGERLTVSRDEHPDLFWGIRGAGANFGVVTSFTYRLHQVGPTVLAGPAYYPLAEAREVLRGYREAIAEAPEELTTILTLRHAPPVPYLPEAVHGEPVVAVGACYAGPLERGAQVVRPLKKLGTPIVDLLQPRPYTELQSMFDAAVPHGWRYYWKSIEAPALTDAAIDTLIGQTTAVSSPKSYCIVFQLGGAIARAGAGETAFCQRQPGHDLNINAVWTAEDGDGERHVAWCRRFFDTILPHARERVYVNFLGDEGQERIRAAYDADRFDRLVALKRRYDPDNFFRANQNISPAIDVPRDFK